MEDMRVACEESADSNEGVIMEDVHFRDFSETRPYFKDLHGFGTYFWYEIKTRLKLARVMMVRGLFLFLRS